MSEIFGTGLISVRPFTEAEKDERGILESAISDLETRLRAAKNSLERFYQEKAGAGNAYEITASKDGMAVRKKHRGKPHERGSQVSVLR